ncbi:MAG: glycosyltransferase family 4 protein [Acidobacteriota bacterium]|nr:glycosyltransferase family 4 protein [Acidobacteriota bacterium]
MPILAEVENAAHAADTREEQTPEVRSTAAEMPPAPPRGAAAGPLRVAMLVENMSFPRDRRVRQEAEALSAAGYRVSVVCPRGEREDRALHETVGQVRVYRYPQPWSGHGALTYALEYGWALLATAIVLAWIGVRHGLDVIHSANPPDMFFVLAAPLRLLGVRYVFDQHDLSPEMYESKFGGRGRAYQALQWLERATYRAADRVIVTNRSFAQIARTRGGLRAEAVQVVRNGPDLDHFHLGAPRPELKRGARYLALYIGVMGKQDGLDRVLEAAQHMARQRGRHDVHFALLGNGDEWEPLQRRARELGASEAFSFPGWMNDEQLMAYLSTADVCLAPDPPVRMNQLSTMIKIMEYMSCGRAIVSFDLLETRRSAGKAALYVPQDDPAQFADAILQLLDDPARRARMGAAGLERVRSELHWGRSREVLLGVYAQLVSEGAARKLAAHEAAWLRAGTRPRPLPQTDGSR